VVVVVPVVVVVVLTVVVVVVVSVVVVVELTVVVVVVEIVVVVVELTVEVLTTGTAGSVSAVHEPIGTSTTKLEPASCIAISVFVTSSASASFFMVKRISNVRAFGSSLPALPDHCASMQVASIAKISPFTPPFNRRYVSVMLCSTAPSFAGVISLQSQSGCT